jgi:hypothetical protein
MIVGCLDPLMLATRKSEIIGQIYRQTVGTKISEIHDSRRGITSNAA